MSTNAITNELCLWICFDQQKTYIVIQLQDIMYVFNKKATPLDKSID